jgi:chromosome segregation ATPase
MLSLEQVRALEERVERAVAYIASIREENAELHRRLSVSETRYAETQSFIDETAEELAAIEEKAKGAAAEAATYKARLEAASAHTSQIEARFIELEAKARELGERAVAAEARAAEAEQRARSAESASADLASRIDVYRADQSRIEEGIVHALEKLDAFEDLILAQAAPGVATAPVAAASAEAEPEGLSAASASPAETASQPPARPLENELDIF